MPVAIKICGLNSAEAVQSVIEASADYAGFVHYTKSPRHVSIVQMAQLRKLLPATVKSVAVLVNPSDDLLAEIADKVQPDFFQLHGDEIVQRLFEIRKKFPHIKLIKAIAVRDVEDIKKASNFCEVADFILFDAKPTDSNMLRGGNGISFDWSIISGMDTGLRWYDKHDWFLSGGLNAGNITEAIQKTGAKFIDVSSGVEHAAGIKDARLIKQFVDAARK